MCELILTEEEKAAPSYLDWSDEALGRAVRACALVISENKKGQKSVFITAAASLLVKYFIDAESEGGSITLENVTIPEEIGNWKVTVERLSDD